MDSTDILMIILISLAVVTIIVTFVFLYFMNGIEKRYESEINRGTVKRVETTEGNEIGEKEKERRKKFVEEQGEIQEIQEIQKRKEEEEKKMNDERIKRLIEAHHNGESRYTADENPPDWAKNQGLRGIRRSARILETPKPPKPPKPSKLREDTFQNLFGEED